MESSPIITKHMCCMFVSLNVLNRFSYFHRKPNLYHLLINTTGYWSCFFSILYYLLYDQYFYILQTLQIFSKPSEPVAVIFLKITYCLKIYIRNVDCYQNWKALNKQLNYSVLNNIFCMTFTFNCIRYIQYSSSFHLPQMCRWYCPSVFD